MITLVPPTPLHNSPLVSDIPARLRWLGEQFANKRADHEPETVIVLTIDSEGHLHSYCFGDNVTRMELVGLFHMAAIKSATKDWD